ncbi:MAG: dicarboxylate/amino acid:cation symporter, partial [Flavobacteriales bacterium]
MNKEKKKLALHWKIIIGMVLGIIFGFLMNSVAGGRGFVSDWVSPFGKLFINLLKLIAVPLILASLIKGVSDLKDISKIKSMGIRTILIYVSTTLVAIIIGLSIVNLVKPGEGMSPETIANIKTKFENSAGVADKLNKASNQNDAGPLQALVDIVPSNIFTALGEAKMLQIIFFALFVGICLLLIPEEKAKPLVNFFDSLNEVVMKMVDLIML